MRPTLPWAPEAHVTFADVFGLSHNPRFALLKGQARAPEIEDSAKRTGIGPRLSGCGPGAALAVSGQLAPNAANSGRCRSVNARPKRDRQMKRSAK